MTGCRLAEHATAAVDLSDVMKKAKVTNAPEILNRRHPPAAEDIELRTAFRQQAEIAELVHEARTGAGLSQRELAKRVGTTASVICRFER